jgi:rare lipoprotein A
MRLRSEGGALGIFRLSGLAALAAALGACANGGSAPPAGFPLAAAPANGPRADYPVVIGVPYSVGDVTYAPEDVLNYDEVGYLAVDEAGGSGVSAAHHTLPLPSYVEVTSLSSGRTILVRVERRGPMAGTELLALSPAALEQLGEKAGAPIRVRRVNPPEEQRALLRAGQPAPLRMDTPMALVDVLKRRLPAQGSASLHAPVAPPPAELAAAPVLSPEPETSPPPVPDTSFEQAFPASADAAPARAEVAGGFIVQAASFSTAERAERAAHALEGTVSPSGRYFRVHTGPFATRGEAEASLAKVRTAGYTDARISKSG